MEKIKKLVDEVVREGVKLERDGEVCMCRLCVPCRRSGSG